MAFVGCSSTAVRASQTALRLQVVQPQGREHFARPGAAFADRRAAASRSAVAVERRSSISGRRSSGACGSSRSTSVRRLRQQPLDALGRPRLAARRARRLANVTHRTCALRPPARQHFDRRRSTRPGGSCGAISAAQLVGGHAPRQARIPALRPALRCPPPAPRESSSAAWDESLRSCPAARPARRNSRSQRAHRSRWLISRRSSCFAKRMRTRCRIIGSSSRRRLPKSAATSVNVVRQYGLS